MLHLTNLISLLCCLGVLALCSEDGSGWTPLLTAVAHRRYGPSSNTHNGVSAKGSSSSYQSSNDYSYATTTKYQYGENSAKRDGPILNDGISVNTYKSAPSYNPVVSSNRHNEQGHNNAYLGIVEGTQQRLNYGMNHNINSYNSAGINNNNHHVGYKPAANINQYGSNGPGNAINGLNNNFGGASMSYADRGNYKDGNGLDSFAVTSYRGTSGISDSKGIDVGKSLIANYASRRPISYDQILNNKIFDQNRNPPYNNNVGSNSGNMQHVGMTYQQNNNPLPPNSNNKNHIDNNGYMKGNSYTNNDDINYAGVNSLAGQIALSINVNDNKPNNNVLAEYAPSGNTGPTSQNNNYNWNNNNNNDGYRQGSPNDNLNERPAGALNNGVKSSYSVDDNYVDGPPQFYQHQAMVPAAPPPFSSTKPQMPPSLQQYNHVSSDLKSYQPNSRPPMASESYPPSPRPPLQDIKPSPPPMVTTTFIPQPQQQLPTKLMRPPLPPQQQQIAPNRQPHQPQPETQYPNQETLQDPNAINDSFFHRLMDIISNTLYYGDLESRRHLMNL